MTYLIDENDEVAADQVDIDDNGSLIFWIDGPPAYIVESYAPGSWRHVKVQAKA